MINKARQRSIQPLVLSIDDLLQFIDQLIEGLSHIVSTSRMVRAQIIGRFPLSDHIISGGIVSSSVMVEDSSLNQKITELDPSGKATQVFNLDIVLLEEGQELVGLIVHDGKDLLSGYPWIVGSVGHWSGVVVAIESSEHDTQSIIQILLRAIDFQQGCEIRAIQGEDGSKMMQDRCSLRKAANIENKDDVILKYVTLSIVLRFAISIDLSSYLHKQSSISSTFFLIFLILHENHRRILI